MKMAESSQDVEKTLWEKKKLLVTSNFSFSHCVFKRLVLQTHKNQGLFGKELKSLDEDLLKEFNNIAAESVEQDQTDLVA